VIGYGACLGITLLPITGDAAEDTLWIGLIVGEVITGNKMIAEDLKCYLSKLFKEILV